MTDEKNNFEDGQCWYLVLQYNHLGGTSPALNAKQSDKVPPILRSHNEIIDGSLEEESWGHLGNAAMMELNQLMPYSKLQFFCTTDKHSRIVHFETEDAGLLEYFKNGFGSGANPSYELFPDHTATYIPQCAPDSLVNSGDNAMTNFPIFTPGIAHWGIGGIDRWECDDYPNDNSATTFHQIYVDAPSNKCSNTPPIPGR
jgi:hypothetical protein